MVFTERRSCGQTTIFEVGLGVRDALDQDVDIGGWGCAGAHALGCSAM